MSKPRDLARKAIDQPHWRNEATRNNLGSSYIAGSVEDMTTDVAAAIVEGRADLLAMLRELEWAGNESVSTCPICGQRPDRVRMVPGESINGTWMVAYSGRTEVVPGGHAPDCRLATLLRECGE